jgi:hypothetical protein
MNPTHSHFMKASTRRRSQSAATRLCALALAAALVCGLTARAADKPQVASTPTGAHRAPLQGTEVVIPKSVFVNDISVGRDPFFPNSTRRKDSMPRVAAVATNTTPTPVITVDLRLKGIAGTKEQRLALINSVTMAQGETADIKCAGGQIVKIRCREIRDHSVLVELVAIGEVRELKLREGV